MLGSYLIFFFCGLLGSVAITAAVLKFVGHRWGTDAPDNVRKTHTGKISRLGGLPLFLVFAAGATWLGLTEPGFVDRWKPVLITTSLMFVLGFIDDIRPLGAKIKLAGQIAIAFLAFGLGMNVTVLGNPFGDDITLSTTMGFLVVVGWLIALPNIINLIDGMDGLATGLGMFLTLTLAVVGISAYDPALGSLTLPSYQAGLISLIVAGALLGFLFFNFPPAKIFLGDGGAYFIGFFIAAASLSSGNKGPIVAPLLVVLVALGIPILDTSFAILRRAIKGLPIFRADADHIHHRLLLLGFSKSNALFTLYAIAGVLSLIGLSFYWKKGFALPIAGGAFFLLAFLGARYLGYVESWRDIRKQVNRALRHRREIQYATVLGDLTEMEVDRCHSADEFWEVFDRALHRLHLYRTPAQVEVSGDEPEVVQVSIPHCPVWEIYYPKNYPRTKNWRALANCMQPAYARAIERWGKETGATITAAGKSPYPTISGKSVSST